MNALAKKIYSGARIEQAEALDLFNWDLIELGQAGDARRRIIHPASTAGFILDRIINYTNICEARCRFCAYHARAGRIPAYEMGMDEILSRVGELTDAGGTQVMLQGGLHPDHGIEFYETMIRTVKEAFPAIYLHSLSPTELVHIARTSGLTLDESLARLQDAGLDSMPGASDMLADRVRRAVSPRKITVGQWRDVMRALARRGMGSSATMTYGLGESLEERVGHLEVVRSTQDETGIIRAFIPWSFSPANTDMAETIPASGVDFLKITAIARIYLDNVRYIQAGWLTEGLGLAQAALAFGANDMGGVLTEEVVVKATGIETRASMEEFIALISGAGRVPVQRDSEYREIRRFA
ncbi:MAG TPA: CofH family radical SAM protein [Spirochaetota bacterium]|nr:CofH family radical SAM protein [Spirochaetota bacterium]HPI91039.1 CofH family radical SAM protein [Spirochaetota bacterium]HPR47296.1 CofH family radical SAM protein [Spirochaetota bacterium]